MNPGFPHMIPAAAPETRNGRPSRLIAGNRRQMHGHLAGAGNSKQQQQQQPPPPPPPDRSSVPCPNDRGERETTSTATTNTTTTTTTSTSSSQPKTASTTTSTKSSATAGASARKPAGNKGRAFPGQESNQSYAGTPPGMPWMAAHYPGGVPPPPPPPREEDPSAYIDPPPARKVDGDLNSFHYKPAPRAGAPAWKPPPPPSEEQRTARMRANEDASSAGRASEYKSQYDSTEKFMAQQRELQDELLKMQHGSEAKREAINAKLAEARARQQEAAAERAKSHAEDAVKRKAEQAARRHQVDAAFQKAQEAARRMEEEHRKQQQQQQPDQQRQKPFSGAADPKAAQEEDFRRRQAAAEARRRREAAANGAPGAKSHHYQQRGPSSGGAAPAPAAAPSKPSASVATLFRKHEAAWTLFEKQTPRRITMATIPWPPSGQDVLQGAVSAALDPSGSNEDAEIRSQFRRLAMRWHPDKFLSKYGAALAESERDSILERVKGVQQAVNQSYSLLKPA